jgi:hypothetical protein
LLVATIAFAGRVAYIFVETRDGLASPDELYYRDAAEQLANGDGFVSPPLFGTPVLPIAEHPPLTVLVLAPASALTDGSELAMRITVALAGMGVVILIGLLAREVAGPRAGLFAAITAAVYPNLFANDGLLMSETFATLGTAAALLFTYRFIRSPGWTNAAGIGVSCAVAMLSRSELALLVPILIVSVLTLRSSWWARLRLAGVVVLAAAIPVAPWVAYNLSRFEEPVLLSHGEGGVLLGANCDDTYAGRHLGSWFGLCALSESEPIEDHSVDAADKRDRALEYIEDHLERLPVVAAARVGRLWSAFRPFQSSLISDGEYRQRWVSRGLGDLLGAARLRGRRGRDRAPPPGATPAATRAGDRHDGRGGPVLRQCPLPGAGRGVDRRARGGGVRHHLSRSRDARGPTAPRSTLRRPRRRPASMSRSGHLPPRTHRAPKSRTAKVRGPRMPARARSPRGENDP